MKNTRITVVAFAVLSFLVPSLRAQAVYTAYRNTRIQAGVGYLYLVPDYGAGHVQGFSFWGDYDVRPWIGVEASVHLGSIITPGDIAEDTYLVGPRLIYHKRKLAVYGKFLFGRATITNQNYNLSSSYNAYALGGGLEYRVAPRINIRAIDFEAQKWPDFPPSALSPTAITIGVSYIIR
jgi:hypothetical protein